MKQLTRAAQAKAREFIFSQARPIEQALFVYYFEGGTAVSVHNALAAHQNDDGGFNGLECDIRWRGSSVIATTVGLQILRAVKTAESHPIAQKAIHYLLTTYDPHTKTWPIVPSGVNEAPHAPWWEYNDELPANFGHFLVNPRAEIVGYLHEYAGLVPAELRQELTTAVLDHLLALSHPLEMHDLLCYVRLAETVALPNAVRQTIWQKLEQTIGTAVAHTPSEWANYGLKPLTVISSPDSPLLHILADSASLNLDYEIEQQQADGSWGPNWSWFGAFPEAWPQAEQEWKGVLTVKTLRQLRDFGRFE